MKKTYFVEQPSSDESEGDLKLDDGLIDIIKTVGKSSRDEVRRDLITAGLKPFDADSTRQLLSRCGVEFSVQAACVNDADSHSFVRKRRTDRRKSASGKINVGMFHHYLGLLRNRTQYGRRKTDFGVRCGLVVAYPLLAGLVIAHALYYFYGRNSEAGTNTLVSSDLIVTAEAQTKPPLARHGAASSSSIRSAAILDPVDASDPSRFSALMSKAAVGDASRSIEKPERKIEFRDLKVADLTVSASHSSWGLASVFISSLSQFDIPGEVTNAIFKTSASGIANQLEDADSIEPAAIVQWSAECFRPESNSNAAVLFGSWSSSGGQGEYMSPCQWIATQPNGEVFSQSLANKVSSLKNKNSYYPVAMTSRLYSKKSSLRGHAPNSSSVMSMPIRLGFLLPLEVKARDTLWDIAKRITGDAKNWEIIAAVNGINPDVDTVIWRTQIIGIPLSLFKPVNEIVDQVEIHGSTESIQMAIDKTEKKSGELIAYELASIRGKYTAQDELNGILDLQGFVSVDRERSPVFSTASIVDINPLGFVK